MPYVGRDEDYEEPLAQPSAMWADLYELTMAQALFLEGRHNQQATFHSFVRKTPHNAAYLMTAGQNIIYEWLDKNWKFTERDLRRLAKKEVKDPKTGKMVKVFRPEFLEMLRDCKLEINLECMPEGEIAFAGEPIYKVSGPVWQCLALESAILNTMNSQSNFATYASILLTAANGKMVAEFGLRRSQAVGGLSSTRGSYVGGISVSSNCWAETNYGIPTIGTMAHAYIMLQETEIEAYMKWAKYNPHLGIYLPDTYEPIRGMQKAIEACKAMDAVLQGYRQDSGDLAYLSKKGKEFATAAGFDLTKNGASNDLDAAAIASLEAQGAPLDLYAVGTKLATVADQPALGGVYKIGNVYKDGLTHEEIIALKQAVREGRIEPKDVRDRVRDLMKLSSVAVKMTYPGELDLIRYLKKDETSGQLKFDGGTIYPEWDVDPISYTVQGDKFSGYLNKDIMSVRKDNPTISKIFNQGTLAYRPLGHVFEKGKLVGNIETVHMARDRGIARMRMLDESHKRLLNPHEHVIGVEESLIERQIAMARRLRNTGNTLQANLV